MSVATRTAKARGVKRHTSQVWHKQVQTFFFPETSKEKQKPEGGTKVITGKSGYKHTQKHFLSKR